MSAKKLKIRVVSKAKNSILAKLADDCGGIKYAAKKIGVSASTYSKWVNFKGAFRPHKKSRPTRVQAVAVALEKETGHNIRDIFPLAKDDLKILAKERIAEHEVGLKALEDYALYKSQKMIEQQVDVGRIVNNDELSDILESQLKLLSYREREVIKLRYGLVDGYSYTLEETCHVFHVSATRIQQIENSALRKLQTRIHMSDLVDFLPEDLQSKELAKVDKYQKLSCADKDSLFGRLQAKKLLTPQ